MSRPAELTTPKPIIRVAAGILIDELGRVLITQRPEGKHLAGWWEFPGGKINESETAGEALTRELDEEIDVAVHATRELLIYTYEYPERFVTLHVYVVESYSGTPIGVEGQALRWEAVDALIDVGLLPADLPIVEALRS